MEKRRRLVWWLIGVGLLIMLVLTWPSKETKTIFCNVGQGDGTLVIQGTSEMLIDVGSEEGKILDCLGKYLPFWDKTVELVIVTHADSDHSGGLEKLKKYYNVQNIYTTNLAKNDVVKMGMIEFEVISPDRDWGNTNDNSTVGILSDGKRKYLMMADASSEVERLLVWRGVLRQDLGTLILKVSHHGSATGTSRELMGAIKVGEAVISVGKNNYGHPTKEVLDRLNNLGIKIRRTDVEGDIVYR